MIYYFGISYLYFSDNMKMVCVTCKKFLPTSERHNSIKSTRTSKVVALLKTSLYWAVQIFSRLWRPQGTVTCFLTGTKTIEMFVRLNEYWWFSRFLLHISGSFQYLSLKSFLVARFYRATDIKSLIRGALNTLNERRLGVFQAVLLAQAFNLLQWFFY